MTTLLQDGHLISLSSLSIFVVIYWWANGSYTQHAAQRNPSESKLQYQLCNSNVT